ncbi:hypothetical protein N7532_008866 [Penicillium argentinense]|uniref:Uncharacterized protein n=1 Tax=Penicillium argentinense TaxID=1131581 RepID=A0A9W9K2X9_9EURO|nr:hypothetical protein N7532_008866 [Penicillium argentinense]
MRVWGRSSALRPPSPRPPPPC